MIEIDVATLPALADYGDSSGRYLVRTDGEFLATVILGHDDRVSEAFVQRLYRVLPHIDLDLDAAEWRITDRFGESPDGPMGETVVWIDGVAFFADHAEDVYFVGAEHGEPFVSTAPTALVVR